MVDKSSVIRDRNFLDSCASRQLYNRRDLFMSYKSLSKIHDLDPASEGACAPVIDVGNIRVGQLTDGNDTTIMYTFQNVEPIWCY